MQPKVSIILLNWNGYEDTRDCLESIMALSYDNYDVILVDNGSVDGSADRLERLFPSVAIIRNRDNLGFAGANNQAMKRAFEQGADYVWLLNNDTLVPRDALSELVRGMEAAEAGLASPLIYFREPAERLQFCGSVIDWKNRQIRHLEQLKDLTHAAAGESLSLWGTALLVKRKVVDDVGYLCEKYFAYHEDEEYSLRANRAGYRCVVVPEARVYHKNSRSTGHNDAPVQVFLRSRNQYFLWMDGLKWKDRIFHVPKYLSRIISYGGSLNDKNLPESLEACLDGMWCGFRGIGGPRRRDIAMPAPLRSLFRFLFSWHPYFWSNLFRGDFGGIRADIVKRLRTGKTSA